MKIAVPRESASGETRVALTPQATGQLVGDGVEVLVQAGAGEASYLPDEAFREAGATIVPDAPALYGQADMVLRVGRPTDEEISFLKPGTVLIGTLGTLSNPQLAEKLAKAGITAISMDAIPRITRAQSMDTLSSQATVGGYKAVLLAAERLPKFMPLLTTAAGTVRPARVLVFGAGVAGLMAIGTARRMGAVVEATDVRPVVKEQVQSLGGTFLEVEMTDEEKAQAETAGGYAREMSDDYKRRQAELIASRVGEADAVITTALIPGRPAPKLITKDMITSMRPGSVIVDMAAEMGGNTEMTEAGKEIVTDNGVRIIGFTNLPATMPGSATQMYAKNIQTLIKHLVTGGKMNLDFSDEITAGATITHDGKVVNPATAKALGIEPAEPATPSAREAKPDASAAASQEST
ncbi:MAG TPA: Re/Si-specific NAD(P)(+) transhydrogenase subunit alpha [Candidatus Limnocylindria bacterium]|jgi:NAD(P) transhydrogenase subunit alpha|nr:Re/Si-specific NAD(P)(+) transhydrogenase subunit alpha [Candidatus Limnocylindria bacterium]